MLTAQGHPRAIFARAIEHGNLVAAEASAREVRNLTLEEALRLVFLYAEKDPIRYDRATRRWLARYVIEDKAVSILKAQLAAAALAELRAGERQQAAKLAGRRPRPGPSGCAEPPGGEVERDRLPPHGRRRSAWATRGAGRRARG